MMVAMMNPLIKAAIRAKWRAFRQRWKCRVGLHNPRFIHLIVDVDKDKNKIEHIDVWACRYCGEGLPPRDKSLDWQILERP